MNRHDLLQLQQIEAEPCLTITLPTHPATPGNRQDKIRMKNLLREARERLLQEFDKAEVASLISRLDEWAPTVDFSSVSSGLALFVSRGLARAITLPFPPPERVVVDRTFLTRDLVFALNRAERYWALVLSEKPTRLFEGVRDSLVEITVGDFPLTHEGPGGEQPLPGGYGIKKSAYRDEYLRKFFRRVDTALTPFVADDPLPLVVVGVERYLAFFAEVTQHGSSIITSVRGSHDRTSAHELGALLWPPVRAAFDDQRQLSFLELEKAAGENRLVSGISEIWRMAREGRGRMLFVQTDFHYPARTDASGMLLTAADDPTSPGVIGDAVDEIIEFVIAKGGQVIFAESGQLRTDPPIQLILRY